MRIVCVGGGPAALFFAALVKRARPTDHVTVLERLGEGDAPGWGVVLSRDAIASVARADPELAPRLGAHLVTWDDVAVHLRGDVVRSSGYPFAALPRRALLSLLADRCRGLGVDLRFDREVTEVDALRRDADLLVGADGAHSAVRARYADHFAPSVSTGRCKFCWLGSDLRLDAFTFLFEESEHGLFQAHAYPFEEGRSTWIVECDEETFRRAGLDRASEADTVRICAAIFRRHLGGARLHAHRAAWRSFPLVRCARWHHEDVALLGDAAHTAHFSIGSGTRLAMEGAIALAGCVARLDLPAALAAYQAERAEAVLRAQRVAEMSRAWFEQAARDRARDPLAFAASLLTRGRRGDAAADAAARIRLEARALG